MGDPDVLVRQLQGALGGVIQRQGAGAVTWPGGTRLSNATRVQHGLPGPPTSIRFGSSSTNVHVAYSNVTASSFDVTANTVDGSSPAAGTTRDFSWEATV